MLTTAQHRGICSTTPISTRNVLFLMFGALLALPPTQSSTLDEFYVQPTPALHAAKGDLHSMPDAEKQNTFVSIETTNKWSGWIFTTDFPQRQDEQSFETASNHDEFPRMVAGYATTELNNQAVNFTNFEQDDIIYDFLDEARYNLATRVMSNGVEVIIASDKIKTPLAGVDVVTEIAAKDSSKEQQHHQLQLRIAPSKAIYRPTTLAASTLKNHMRLVMPSQNTEPVNFSLPVDFNQFVTKICLTTYTYRTTYLQNRSTTVESQEHVISNITTEERNYFRMTPSLSVGVTITSTPALEIGIFPTTYSYYNTILDAELPLVQASRRTIINKIIGPDNYIHFLQPSEEANPAHETNTYYSKLRFTNKLHNGGDERIVTTTNMLTQVIVTESLPSRSTTLLTIRKEPLEANSSLNITKTVQAWSLKSTPNSLNTEYDVHIYTTKTFITTFTYFKTSLLSASDDEDFTTTHSISLPKNLTITGLSGLAPTTVINYHTRVIENVITEMVPSSLINNDLVSKFRAELKKGENEQRVIITTVSLLGGQKLEITAVTVFKSALKTALSNNQTISAPAYVTISPTIAFTTPNQKITKLKKSNHNTVSTATIKRTKISVPTATLKTYNTQIVKASLSIDGKGVLADETDGNNVGEKNGGDSLPTNSKNSAIYVNKSPTLKKPQKGQQIESDNKNRFPVAVNQLIGSLNFQRLTALKPVFNAMAGLLQTKFASALNPKNVSSHNQQKEQLQQSATSPLRGASFDTEIATDGMSLAKLDNSADYENRQQIESSTMKQQEKPIYIPIKDANFPVDNRRQQLIIRAVDYAAELLDTGSAQSLHIQPPKADVTISDDENSWLLQRTANDSLPQQLTIRQASPDYASQTQPKILNQKLHGESIPAGFEMSLINGGIPIRPGEVITANSDVIIGTPNGIQFPRMPVPKRNILTPSNPIQTNQNTPPANPLQQQSEAYRDKSPINTQMSSSFPHRNTYLYSHSQHRQHNQQNQNHAHKIKNLLKENYDSILRPPPVGLLKLSGQTVAPLSPPPLPSPTSTNSYTTLGTLSPPALTTSPSLITQYSSQTPALVETTNQVNAFTYENQNNKTVTSTHKPKINFVANYSKTSLFGEKIIGENRPPNLYDVMLYTPQQSADFYQKFWNTTQQENNGNTLLGQPNVAQHHQDRISTPEFSSNSYFTLSANYDMIRGVAPPLPEPNPIGSPSNHQNINLHNHVFSHNVNMHAPPLTFKKETDHPTHASAVHGQIPGNVGGTTQHLSFTIANMPHIKIPHNEKQVQISLTPQNIIGQITKPNTRTKHFASTSVETPPITYSGGNTASSTVIGSFTLDGNLNELLKTQQSPLKSNVPSPRIALKLQQKNYAQPYVKAHSNRVNVRDDVEDVSGFHRAIIPASSAIVTSSVQNIYRNYKPATPVQLTNGLPWPSLVSTHMNSDWPPYKLQASQYTSNSSAFSIPSSKIIKDNGAKNANPIVGDNNTPVIYYDQDNTINEAVSLSNSNEYENENVVAVAFANDDSDIIKPNDVHNVNGTNSNAVDLRVDPNTESATNILQRQFKTKQQQLKNLSRLHDTTEHNNNNKYVTPAQKWQENNIHQQSLYPFLLPNSTIEMNDLYSLQPTTYYVTSGTKESSFITSPTTTQTNVRHKLKSRPLHSPLLFRGVPFRVENSPTLEKQVKQQTTTQSVYIAKGEGFKRPGVGAEEALFSLEDEFSYNPARTSFIVNDKKHIHLETTMPPEMNNNYDNIASMLQTTSAPVPAKFITLQRLSSLSSSATQFLTIASTSKIANLNTITVESIQSAETSTYKPKQLFSEHNFDITAASENSNVYRKHISRVNQSILHHSNIRSQLTTAASMEQQISSSLRITPALGHKQLNVKSVVGLNPPPQKQPPHAVLLAPIKLEPLYTSDSSNNNTHVYNTISFKTMWQAPLQTLSETNGHEISSIPRSTDRRPLQQPKPIQMTYTLRNTTMLLGIIPKSAVTIITGDSKYYEDKLTNISTNIRNSSVWDISTSAISSIISITEKTVTSSSNQEFTKYANANTDKIPYNEIVKSSQLQYKEKIATYIEQEPQQNENIATVNGQHLKLNLKPLLESSESTSVETTNTMTSVSLSHTMHLPQDSSANQLNHVSLKKVSNQYKKQQIPTKYITRTEFLTVTTTRNTVILTSANERLQSKLFMVTRSKTATLVNSITHTEWTTETETDTTIAIATKTHTRTLVQPTKLIESYIILAPTTITKIETEIIAPGNGLIGEMGSTAIKAEGTESNTNIPYIINHNHKPSEFKKPQLNHEHFAYDVNSSIKYNKSNNNMYNEDISIIAQAIVKNDTSVDTTRIIPLEYGNKIAVSNESISNTTLPAINADKITPNNSIFIVLTNSQKGGKPKPPNDIADDLIGGSGNGVDTNPATIKLDYDDGWSVFNLPARVEESISLDHGSRKIKNQVLLGGVLIATPPKLLYDYSDTDAGTGADGTVTTCQPSCKMTRNEVCSLTDLQWRCVCRPGFARMFPDRSCKPTYTYTMHIQTDRIGNYKLLYDSTLDDNSTNHYKQLATFAKEAIDRMVMQSDFRDIYHGVKLTKFIPIEENYFPKDNTKYNQQGISANFLLQLSENSDEKRLVGVFKKYLRLNNYSIGGTELFTNRNGVESLAIKDFDECVHVQFHDCSPNANCFNLQGTYTCSCKEDFADFSTNSIYPGRVCSAELIGCDQCHYHGKCAFSKFEKSKSVEDPVCECFAWYTGATCQVNLKILLIALIAVGTSFLTLLMFCILLVFTKRQSLRHKALSLSQPSTGINRIITEKNSALAGVGFIGGYSKHGISGGRSKSNNFDKCVMIKDTSSESSQNSMPFLLKKEYTESSRKSYHRSRHPDTNIESGVQGEQPRYITYERLSLDEATNRTTNESEKFVVNTKNSFTDLKRDCPDQSDRSLTVMIPRAKYHAAVLPQTQLFHQQVILDQSKEDRQRIQQKQHQINKSKNTASTTITQDKISSVLHHKKIAKITPKKPSTGGYKYPAPISIPNIIGTDCGLTNIHLHHLGALVSAGFEVSAIVGENILNTDRSHTSTSARTKGNKDNFEVIVAGLDTSGDGSFSAVSETWNTDGNSTKKRFYQTAQSFSEEQKQQQQLEQPNQLKQFLSRSLVEQAHSRNSTMQYSAGENLNREHNVAYECNNESAETHSIDIMKPINICFDAQTTNTNDEAGTTMAERDVGSTFLLPHTHLYKSDMRCRESRPSRVHIQRRE